MNIHFVSAYDTQGRPLYQRRNPGMLRRRGALAPVVVSQHERVFLSNRRTMTHIADRRVTGGLAYLFNSFL